MISGAGLCWQHVGGVGSTTTTTHGDDDGDDDGDDGDDDKYGVGDDHNVMEMVTVAVTMTSVMKKKDI